MSIEINGKIYRELRCPACRKLFCYEYVYTGRIAINCPRCDEFTVFNFKNMKKSDKNAVDWDREFKLKSNMPKKGGD